MRAQTIEERLKLKKPVAELTEEERRGITDWLIDWVKRDDKRLAQANPKHRSYQGTLAVVRDTHDLLEHWCEAIGIEVPALEPLPTHAPAVGRADDSNVCRHGVSLDAICDACDEE